ncbi:hypothetical protein AURDEDRAFT_115151 [Auricularia subglabra TFB-10046 SS5]|nr:hypothetical protein AURDEDRAFT_115151 [Auricularia subglabra TFB-10046 SS5]
MFFSNKKLRFAFWFKREESTVPDNTAQNRPRIALDMSVPGKWTCTMVPPARLGFGVVDEGVWPRTVRLDGQKVKMKRDQWDAIKLKGSHDCFIPARGFPTATRKRAVAGRAPPPLSFAALLERRAPGSSAMSIDTPSSVSLVCSAMSVDAPSVLSSLSAPKNAHGKRPKVRFADGSAPKRVHMTKAVLVKTAAARALHAAQRAAYVARRIELFEAIRMAQLLYDAAVQAQRRREAAQHARELAEMRERLRQMDEEDRRAREELRRRQEEEQARQRELEELLRRVEAERLKEEARRRELEQERRREEARRLEEEKARLLEEERRRAAAASLERRLRPELLIPRQAYDVWRNRLAHFKDIRKGPADIHIRDIPFPVLYSPEYSLHLVDDGAVVAFLTECEAFLKKADLDTARKILHPDLFRKQCIGEAGYAEEADAAFVDRVMTRVSAQLNSAFDKLVERK